MTYNVSSGTLNPTIPIPICLVPCVNSKLVTAHARCQASPPFHMHVTRCSHSSCGCLNDESVPSVCHHHR